MITDGKISDDRLRRNQRRPQGAYFGKDDDNSEVKNAYYSENHDDGSDDEDRENIYHIYIEYDDDESTKIKESLAEGEKRRDLSRILF